MNMEQQKRLQAENDNISPWRAAWPFWCFLVLVAMVLIPVFIDVIPQRDAAFRYAPMAEAFRDGDFIYAFHPRTGFLHTFTAGVFAWLLHCGGFMACKLSSMLFIALPVFPLYGIMRRVYSRFMAEITTFIYIFASQLQRLGWSGLRDSHKCFLILLSGYALIVIYQQREKWSGYIWLGIATGLGIVTRGDLVLYMSLVFFWGIVMELKLKKLPFRSICGSALAVLLSLPAIFLNWYLAGVAVPEIRFAWLFRKVMNRYPQLDDTLPLIGLSLIAAFLAAWALRRLCDAGFGKILGWLAAAVLLFLVVRQCCSEDFYLEDTVWGYFDTIFHGFFPVYAVAGLVGIGFRLARKQWIREESILAAMLFGHAVLVCSQIILNDHYLFVSSRYLIPVMPLELGWSVTGILVTWEFLTRPIRSSHPRLVQNAGYIAFALAVCGFLYDFYQPVMREYMQEKGRIYREGLARIAETIRNDYRGPAQFRPEVDPGQYIPKLNPAILYLSKDKKKQELRPDFRRQTISAFLAKGRVTDKFHEADYVVEKYAENNRLPDGLILLREVNLGKEKYRIWKKIK